MNRKATAGFPISLKLTAYVAPKPPKGDPEMQSGSFLPKFEQ